MNSGYEVIMCIINAGYSELVMDAAKEVGAGGGTVIHARGTANQEAEKFFQITIQPDKDIVMILVPSQIKDDVLHAVYQSAGLKTAGQGIAFSMPVDNVVGLSAAAATRVKESAPTEAEAQAEEIAPTETEEAPETEKENAPETEE